MCSIPPPPPPPLPPPPTFSNLSESKSPICNFSSSKDHDLCKWALSSIHLWEACSKNSICITKPPYKYKYKNFDPILQNGPTCGLTALSMLVGGKVTVNEMLNITKVEGFSYNGEMFSCFNMEKLAKRVLSLINIKNIACFLKKGDLRSHGTVEKLLNGAVLLVPYDADFNHSPCLKQGHKAHWALVCGVIVCENPEDSYTSDASNVFVLGRHGKSKHLAAWRLDKLDESNKNLWEISPKREDDGLEYVLPQDGIGGDKGLRGRYLLFE